MYAFVICTHAWLQFSSSVQLPGCYLPSADGRIDPSDITCASGDLVRQQLSIMFQLTIETSGV